MQKYELQSSVLQMLNMKPTMLHTRSDLESSSESVGIRHEDGSCPSLGSTHAHIRDILVVFHALTSVKLTQAKNDVTQEQISINNLLRCLTSSLQSSHPGLLKTLMLVYILITTRRFVTVKHTACVTMSHRPLDGRLTKLDGSPEGGGMADRLPVSHGGSPCLSLSGENIILAGRVRAFTDPWHLACARN